jgi:hypothetical protein
VKPLIQGADVVGVAVPVSVPTVLVSVADTASPADFEVEVDAAADFETDGLVLPDVPAAGDDFGLLFACFVGLVCTDPPRFAQSVLDGEGAGLDEWLAFGLPVAGGVAVAVLVAFGEPVPDALAVPVDGATGGLVMALAEAVGLVVAGGVLVMAGLLVFGDVRGDEVGEADAGRQDGAATAMLDAVAAPTAPLLVAPADAELAASPGAP